MSKKKKHRLLLLCILPLCVAAWWIPYLLFRGPLDGDLNHDFGIVLIERPHTIVEHVFQLRNRTNHTIQLVNAKPSCGCTTTEWPKDPVPSGEIMRIPVHLKLQKSQLRRSSVLLEFASGEHASLHIEGTGRFKIPFVVSPPDLEITRNDADGTRGVLRLEWYDKSEPPLPVVVVQDGVRVEFEKWRFVKDADSHKGTPQIWTKLLYVFLDDEHANDGTLGITIGQSPLFEVPYTIIPK